MKLAIRVNPNTIERFLDSQYFRNGKPPKGYAYTLRAFHCFVWRHSADAELSAPVVKRWLGEARLKWDLLGVCRRARLIERFLEWLQERELIHTNPFDELHRLYGQRTRPIVRAMLGDNAESALQKLRPLPRFGSFMGKLMEAHISQMRTLGYRYDANEALLLSCDRFLQTHTELDGAPLKSLVEAWSKSRTGLLHRCKAQSVGQMISKAMHRLDPSVQILSVDRGLERRARRQLRRPYHYTDEEIRRLLHTALSLPSPRMPLRPLMAYTMLILAYCAGLRVGEIVHLSLGDVNLQDNTIEIRETKFFKHRRLPLSPGVMAVLVRYLAARKGAGAPMGSSSPLFWNQNLGHPYTYGGVRTLLVAIMRRSGLKQTRGTTGPRIHDLRHTMVAHRMRDWYRQGINPQDKLPYLATYLGHKDIHSTLAYLHTTPEVLQKASERFRKRGARVLSVTGEQP